MAIFLAVVVELALFFIFCFFKVWEEKLILKTLFLFSAFCFSQKKNLGGGVGDDELNNRRRELN